jgi:hypothetical protein
MKKSTSAIAVAGALFKGLKDRTINAAVGSAAAGIIEPLQRATHRL